MVFLVFVSRRFWIFGSVGVEVSWFVRVGELKVMGDWLLLIEILGIGSDVLRVR